MKRRIYAVVCALAMTALSACAMEHEKPIHLAIDSARVAQVVAGYHAQLEVTEFAIDQHREQFTEYERALVNEVRLNSAIVFENVTAITQGNPRGEAIGDASKLLTAIDKLRTSYKRVYVPLRERIHQMSPSLTHSVVSFAQTSKELDLAYTGLRRGMGDDTELLLSTLRIVIDGARVFGTA